MTIDRLADILLAPDCLLCGAAATADGLCAACAAELPALPAAHCPRCALPTPHGETCGGCLSHPPAFEATFAPWIYAWPLDRLVQALKYGQRLSVARLLGRQMAAVLPDDADVHIVPVPLAPERLRERGFNQALELARLLPGRLLPDACLRLRDTRAQALLSSRQERQGNVRGAFACLRPLFGATVVLVDDVMTSGATLDELAKAVRAQGAARVLCCVAARTPKN